MWGSQEETEKKKAKIVDREFVIVEHKENVVYSSSSLYVGCSKSQGK